MAFAKGVFEGYNNMRQQEREFAYEMELLKQKGINEQAKLEGPQMFQIMGANNTGQPITYDLFNLAEKDTYGSVEERGQENLVRLFDYTLKPVSEIMNTNTTQFMASGADPNMSFHDYLKEYDTLGYQNLLAKHDGLARAWVKRNTREPKQDGGMYQYMWGKAFTQSTDHPFQQRFRTIARSEFPVSGDRNHIINSYIANNGAYFLPVNLAEYGESFGDAKNAPEVYKQNLYSTALDIAKNSGRILGKSGQELIDDTLSNYAPAYFDAYMRAKTTFENIQFNGGTLDDESRNAMNAIIADQKYKKIFYDENDNLNISNVTKFFRMGVPGAEYIDSGGAYYTKITSAEQYVKRVLMNEKGLQGMKDRADSSFAAIQTINQMEQTFPRKLREATITRDGKLEFRGKTYNPEDEEDMKSFFTGAPAGIISWGVGMLTKDGAWGQIKDAVIGSGLSFEGAGTSQENEAIQKRRWLERIVDSNGNISVRAMLNEILIYQVAAALQGGTGGRTISDNDVQRVQSALGTTLTGTRQTVYIRLQTLKQMMKRIYDINSVYANSRDVQGYKAADLTSQLIVGNRLDEMTLGQAADFVGDELDAATATVTQEREIRQSQGFALTSAIGVSSYEDFVPKDWHDKDGSYDEEQDLNDAQQYFVDLPIEDQRRLVNNFRKWRQRQDRLKGKGA